MRHDACWATQSVDHHKRRGPRLTARVREVVRVVIGLICVAELEVVKGGGFGVEQRACKSDGG